MLISDKIDLKSKKSVMEFPSWQGERVSDRTLEIIIIFFFCTLKASK